MRKTFVVIASIILSLSSIVFANDNVKIEDVSQTEVIKYLIQDWTSKGFSISSNTGNEVAFRKPAPDKNFMDRYGFDSDLQLTFGIKQISNDVNVSVKAEAVTRLSGS